VYILGGFEDSGLELNDPNIFEFDLGKNILEIF
jgi:hypothetical protein